MYKYNIIINISGYYTGQPKIYVIYNILIYFGRLVLSSNRCWLQRDRGKKVHFKKEKYSDLQSV